jgi:hypothetical protein
VARNASTSVRSGRGSMPPMPVSDQAANSRTQNSAQLATVDGYASSFSPLLRKSSARNSARNASRALLQTTTCPPGRANTDRRPPVGVASPYANVQAVPALPAVTSTPRIFLPMHSATSSGCARARVAKSGPNKNATSLAVILMTSARARRHSRMICRAYSSEETWLCQNTGRQLTSTTAHKSQLFVSSTKVSVFSEDPANAKLGVPQTTNSLTEKRAPRYSYRFSG